MLGVPGIAISFAGHNPETMSTYRDAITRLVGHVTSLPDFPATRSST